MTDLTDPTRSLVRYTRYTPGPSPLSSSLTVAGDTVSARTDHGVAVGRFTRRLDDAEQARLAEAVAAAGGLGAVVQPAGTGTVERLIADGVDLALAPPADPPAAAADLVGVVRDLDRSLASHPVAGLRLAVRPAVDDADGHALLEHIGTEAVLVRLGTLALEATAYDADHAVVDSLEATVDVGIDGPVEPGWSVRLADLPIAVPDGGYVVVSVGPTEVDVDGSGVVQATHLAWTTP
ncbi:hypothetical protein ABFT23_03410 [Nocardioides sp. C4-1]|uniref:hypothetical protein n=1 Tax=Nocardioides sp. C4-1 TaxID=3151851 RepID=UPI0032656EBD